MLCIAQHEAKKHRPIKELTNFNLHLGTIFIINKIQQKLRALMECLKLSNLADVKNCWGARDKILFVLSQNQRFCAIKTCKKINNVDVFFTDEPEIHCVNLYSPSTQQHPGQTLDSRERGRKKEVAAAHLQKEGASKH